MILETFLAIGVLAAWCFLGNLLNHVIETHLSTLFSSIGAFGDQARCEVQHQTKQISDS